MFTFNDVLDHGRLRDSLETVVQRDGWRRLGARLRRNVRILQDPQQWQILMAEEESGRLEYRIPAVFTPDRPAIKFTHVDHQMPMAAHPIASRLPTPSSRVAAVANPDVFMPLSRDLSSPRSLQHYIDSQESQLGLHVVSFNDATLVSLHCPHNLLDGMGITAVLDAWTLALQGRHMEIPETYPVDCDPLAELGQHHAETHKLSKQRMSTFQIVCYGLRNMYKLLIPDLERRIICVPATFLTPIRRDALLDLQADNPDVKDLFLSEGDVLCAWWMRLCAATQVGKRTNRTVAFYNTHSLKSVLSRDLLRRPYLGNAFQLIAILFKMPDLLKKPLGFLAQHIRQTTQELGSRGQAEAFAAMWRASRFNLIPIFGNSGMLVITCSNWTKARFFDVDFSTAVSKHKSSNRHDTQRVGTPSFVYHNRLGSDALIGQNVLIIMGKDEHGNYWLDACARRKYWPRIEKMLAKASQSG